MAKYVDDCIKKIIVISQCRQRKKKTASGDHNESDCCSSPVVFLSLKNQLAIVRRVSMH